MSQEQRRNISNVYNKMQIRQLEKDFPEVPWLDYLKNILLNGVVSLDPSEEILIADLKYLQNFVRMIKTTPKRQTQFLW